MITYFAILYEKLGISPTFTLFRAFFEFKSLGNRLYAFVSRPELGIFRGMPDKEKGWMKSFLVARLKEHGPLKEWDFDPSWTEATGEGKGWPKFSLKEKINF